MGEDKLHLSVIISTRNRADQLRETLICLSRQQLDELSWETIVIDNGSEDGQKTARVIADLAGQLPLVALSEPAPGKNRALNRALEHARGDLLVFTDDDIVPTPRWLAELHAAAARWPDEDIFCGAIDPRYPPATPEWIHDPRLNLRPTFGFFHPADQEGIVDAVPFGANLALRSRIFETMRYNERIGPRGTHYAMGSEYELLARLRGQGYRFVYVPQAAVEHIVRSEQVTERWLYLRNVNRGRGDVHRDPDVSAPRMFRVPRYLWRRLLVRWINHLLGRLRGDVERIATRIALCRIQGYISEYRTLAREASKKSSDEESRRSQRDQGTTCKKPIS